MCSILWKAYYTRPWVPAQHERAGKSTTDAAADRLNLLWQTCLSKPEIATEARQALSLVTLVDALRLIDETLVAWKL